MQVSLDLHIHSDYSSDGILRLEEIVAGFGWSDRLGNITVIEQSGADLAADPEGAQRLLAAACREAYALFADDFRNIYSGEDVPLEVECPDAPIVFADETATIQIIWNIFGNELKYAAHASRVKAKIHADGATVYLEISDTGPGMTRRELKRAFNRYWRAKTVRKSGQGGFGIGLCVAREEARAMGGDLALKANNPTGCRYILSLPAPAHRQ